MKPLQDKKYSLKWANSVVLLLWNKYPRATNFLMIMYGIDQKKAAWLLANHQRRWNNYKQAVHITARWYSSLEKHSSDIKEFTPQVIHSLDNCFKRNNLLKTT